MTLRGPEHLVTCVKTALSREVMVLPLPAAIQLRGPTLLALCVDGLAESVDVLGEPVSAQSPQGWPLRLSPLDDFGEGELLAALASAQALSHHRASLVPRAVPTAAPRPTPVVAEPPVVAEQHPVDVIALEPEPVAPASIADRRPSELPTGALPLDDEKARFPEFFVALAAAVRRTGYFQRSHPEFRSGLAKLAAAVAAPLAGRREISFVRSRAVTQDGLSTLRVQTGLGEVFELRKVIGMGRDDHANAMSDVCVRKHVVLLTLKEGVGEDELAELLDLISGVERPMEELHAELSKRPLPHVSILLEPDLVGSDRALPWQVELCISRLVRELKLLPLLRGAGEARLNELHAQVLVDIVRPLTAPETLLALISNADVIESEASMIPEFARMDVADTVAASLPLPTAATFALPLVDALELEGDAGKARRLRVAQARIVERLLSARTPAGDASICVLHRRGVVSRERLPTELLAVVDAETLADALKVDPATTIAQFAAALEDGDRALLARVAALAVPLLVERDAPLGLAALVRCLRPFASRDETDLLRAMAERVQRALEEPTTLRFVVHALLVGEPEVREAARELVLVVGRPAGHMLCQERLALGDRVAGRARFVGTLRELGLDIVPFILAALTDLERDTSDDGAASALDFLRALPERRDETLGRAVERLLSHPHESVRSLATRLLAPTLGSAAAPQLHALLRSGPEQLRIDAIGGLRRIGGIDRESVALLAKILIDGDVQRVELMAAAASALSSAVPEARESAGRVLKMVLQPRRTSITDLLRGSLPGRKYAPLVLDAVARSLSALDRPASVRKLRPIGSATSSGRW